MKQCIEQIYATISPSSLISRRVTLKQRGAEEFLGLCPFHSEKTPSFSVSDKAGKEFYHCFGCGAHGDIFTFMMKHEGLSYREALEELARQCGITLPKYTPKQVEEENKTNSVCQLFEITANYYQQKLNSSEGKAALQYLKNRGLSENIIQEYRLGYAPQNSEELTQLLLKRHTYENVVYSTVLMEGDAGSLYNMFRGRVIFPIIDKRGQVIAFGGRILDKGEPKYLNSPDNPVFKKGLTLYGMHKGFEKAYKAKEAIIVEGYMDVIALANYGITNAFAPLGTALKMEQVTLLWNICEEPIICMDSDNAGRNATEKIAIAALAFVKPGKSLKIARLYNAKDPDEMVNKFGIEVFKESIKNAKPLGDMLFELEVARSPVKTPEQRLGLKQRLVKLCEHIQEKDMQKAYYKFFMDSYFSLLNVKTKDKDQNNKELDQGAIVASVMSQKHAYIHEIFCILRHFPQLLLEKDTITRLSNIEITCKKLDSIRNKLLSVIDPRQLSLMRNEQEEIIKQKILSSLEPDFALSGVESFGALLHIEDPRVHLERLFGLDELNALQEQIMYVRDRLYLQPSAELFEKLKHLKNIEEKLKTQLGIN